MTLFEYNIQKESTLQLLIEGDGGGKRATTLLVSKTDCSDRYHKWRGTNTTPLVVQNPLLLF